MDSARTRLLFLSALLPLVSGSGAALAQEPPPTPVLTVDETSISWTGVAGASSYDLIRGDVETLRQTGGDFTAATKTCLVDDSGAPAFADAGVPKPGQAFWFLVRANSGAQAGTYDSGGGAQAGSRDAEIEAAPGACYSPVVAHPPIAIDGDAGFTAENGVVGGSGTIADPYLIAGWDVACSPPEYLGIAIQDTTLPFTVRNVRVSGCQYGIAMAGVQNGRVERSRAVDVIHGIYMIYSQECTIEGNRVSLQTGCGIYASDSTNIVVRQNTLDSGFTGICLDASSGCAVYHNDILGNTRQAKDENGGPSAWNDVYPGGGNYWTDYQGVDQCRGPAQDDCSGPDGFGDQPHPFAPGGADVYPRMIPDFAEGDVAPPAVAITSPAAGAVFTASPIAVNGTAADDGSGVRRVELRVNGGAWTIPNGTSSWNSLVGLAWGSNTLEARAVDHGGNVSATSSIPVTNDAPWEAVVQTDKTTYAPGEPVAINFSLTNHTSSPVTLHFGSTCQANFRVESDELGVVDVNSLICFTMTTQRTWQPNETVTYQFTWNQVDDNGQQVPVPGDYRVIGYMLSSEVIPEAPRAIAIAP